VQCPRYEAEGFARWAGARLPQEAEWGVATAASPVAGNLFESGGLHPAATRRPGPAPAQLFGDVWEWTGSPYTPYPGTGRWRARSANTTASSCAINTVCAEARV
jgi:formylglycine-generating enzyme required for sulfatase activity